MNIFENKFNFERIALCWRIDKFYEQIEIQYAYSLPSLATFGELLKEIKNKNSYEYHIEFANLLLPALDAGFINKRYWKLYNKLIFDAVDLGSEFALCMKGGMYISGSNPLIKIDIEKGEELLIGLVNKQNIDPHVKTEAENFLFRFSSDIIKEKQKKAEERNIVENNNLTYWEWDQVDGKIDPYEIASSIPILNSILKKREKEIIKKNKKGKKDFSLSIFDSFFMNVSSIYIYLKICLLIAWEYVRGFMWIIFLVLVFYIIAFIDDYRERRDREYISSTYGHHRFVNIEDIDSLIGAFSLGVFSPIYLSSCEADESYERYIMDSLNNKNPEPKGDVLTKNEYLSSCLNSKLVCTKYKDYFVNDRLNKDCSNYTIDSHYPKKFDTNNDGILDLNDFNHLQSLKNRLESNINTFDFSFKILQLYRHDRSLEWMNEQHQLYKTKSDVFRKRFGKYKPYGILTRSQIASITQTEQSCLAIQFIHAYINNPEKEDKIVSFLSGVSSKDFISEWNKYIKYVSLEDDFEFLCIKYNSRKDLNMINIDFPDGSIKDLKKRFNISEVISN